MSDQSKTSSTPSAAELAEFAEFAEFFRATRKQLIAFLLRNGTSQPDADNFAQEAMISLFKVWGSVTNRTAYVYKVAIRALNTHRAQRRQDRGLIVKMAKLGECTATVVSPGVELVRWALRSLKPEQRLVMALTVDGFKPAEIAELTSRSAATVRSNLRFARENLLKKLDISEEGGVTWTATSMPSSTSCSSPSGRQHSTPSMSTSSSS
ncbi:RNA polymerase sigma factor [Dactylosporangium sp. NPDC000244]|uniref:RNA polymerase sigma factor n=1 Tax=Dactylosporangium sp. NPDC000244 TaxID=3154365 RepID=UPI00332FB091